MIKIVLLGDSGVGKTCLLNQYIRNQFILAYKATIGSDFLTKTIQKDNCKLNLQLWDTAGTEKFNSVSPGFYRNTESCVLVFDLTNKDSFDNIEFWKKNFLNSLNPPEGDKYPFVLIGNKNDLNDSIKVKDQEIQKYCSEHNNMPYFSCSAKDCQNIEEAFSKVVDLAYERVTKDTDIILPEIQNIKIEKEPQGKKCC